MLRQQVRKIGEEAGAEAVAAAFYDYETATAWSTHGHRWFHAASTIKVAVLAGLFDASAAGRFRLDDRLHVRNFFLSAADGEPFRVASGRDANTEVHAALGKTMRLNALALHMIATSSNLATNLLLDLVGVETTQATLERIGADGLAIHRGVEDERAFEKGLNNEVTADGLVRLFRLIHDGEVFSKEASEQMMDILFQQQFTRGIPAGLPDAVRNDAQVAHKTGEISTVAHDAGLVFLPNRQPYVLAILTEWAPGAADRKETVAKISRALYEHLVEESTAETKDVKS